MEIMIHRSEAHRREKKKNDQVASEEVLRHFVALSRLARLSRGRLKDLEVLVQVFIQFKDGGDVAATVAVIRRGPDRDEGIVEHRLVTLHHQLMRAADEV